MSTFRCRDCGIDVVAAGHWYMVHDHIWAAAGGSTDDGDYLCIHCLEQRLGCPVGVEDFKPALPTTRVSWWAELGRMLPHSWRPLR